jgi:hypothetical protein
MFISSSSAIRYGLLFLLTIQVRHTFLIAHNLKFFYIFFRFISFILLTKNTATVLSLRVSMINASASKNEYVVSTLVLTMELIKLSIVLTLLMTVKLKFSVRKTFHLLYNEILCRPIDTFPLAVPSFLYVLQDNLIIYALSCVDAATYQVKTAEL